MAVLWGKHAVWAALRNPNRTLEALYTTEPISQQRCPVHVVSPAELRKRVPDGAVHQGMVLYTKNLPTKQIQEVKKGPLLVLDHITDPHNVGSLWRSAAAFGVQGIVLTKHHSPALEGVVAKVASGALEHVPAITVSNLVAALTLLKKQGFFCYGLCETGTEKIQGMDKEHIALILGNESKGLRPLTRKACDGLVSIPTEKNFPTLSVSMAGAVALYAVVS